MGMKRSNPFNTTDNHRTQSILQHQQRQQQLQHQQLQQEQQQQQPQQAQQQQETSRNGSQQKKIPNKPPVQPLISDSMIDLSSQKIFVISILVIIQAWKLYDLLLLKNADLREIINNSDAAVKAASSLSNSGVASNSGISSASSLAASNNPSFISNETYFVLKYFLLDSICIWVLSILRLPNLTYKPITNILLIFLSLLISLISCTSLASIFIPFTSILSNIWKTVVPEKELNLTNDYIDSSQIIDQSHYFKGKKTIRFLPDSSIKLNPYHENYCLQNSYSHKIKVPVKFNSTGELDYLQVQYRNFDNEISLFNYTKKDLNHFFKNGDYSNYYNFESTYDERVSFLELSFNKPGHYKILTALDSKARNIRSFKNDLIIPMCPHAHFDYSNNGNNNNNKNIDKCIDDSLSNLSITIFGVPPLTLVYEEEINGELSNLPNSIIVPNDNFKSPLLSRDYYTGEFDEKLPKLFNNFDLKDISWANSRSINVDFDNRKIEKIGKYIYTINKIIDGFGNEVYYTPDPSDVSTFFMLNSHPKPVISLVDSNSKLPILIGKKKRLDLRLNQVQCVECESPYEVNFRFVSEDGSKNETFSKKFYANSNNNNQFFIDIEEPGIYSVESALSKYCPIKIGASTVNVLAAKLPSVHITADPVIDKCVGTTEYKFNFEFIGTGPFEIGYKVSVLDPNNPNRIISTRDVKTIRSQSTVLEFDYKPPAEGSYMIDFLTLSDHFYKNQVKFSEKEYRYITYFKKRPRAYFNKNSDVQKISICNGEDANIKLYLEGKPPFKVVYDLISPNFEVTTENVEEIMENEYFIKTPKLSKGGDYVLSLKSVVDNSNCGVGFKGQEVHLNVRKDIPQLSFIKSESLQLVQGKTLNVQLRSELDSLIDLTYEYQSLDGSSKQQFVHRNFNPVNGFNIDKSGIYKLIKFNDKRCPGLVPNDYEIRVTYFDKPTLKLIENESVNAKESSSYNTEFVSQTQCENDIAFVEFEATGVSPFVIDYSITYPDGHTEQKSEQMSNKLFKIHMKTSQKGDYVYNFYGIADSIYQKDIMEKLKHQRLYSFSPIKIYQTISQLPYALFTDVKSLSSGLHNKDLHNNKLLHPHNPEFRMTPTYQTCSSNLGDLGSLDPISISLIGKPPFNVKLAVRNEITNKVEVVELENIQSHIVKTHALYEGLDVGTHVVSFVEIIDSNGCFQSEFDDKNEAVIIVNDIPKIRHLSEEIDVLNDGSSSDKEEETEKASTQTDSDLSSNNISPYYCVGDHITYLLSGVPPFNIYYEFNDANQKVEINNNLFRRRVSQPGSLTILALSDSSSRNCVVNFTAPDFSDESVVSSKRNDLNARIYDLPSVEISHGEIIEEDIHEGETVEIVFTFTGHPPFKLTYIRTEPIKNGQGGSRVVETEVVDDIYDYEYRVSATLEGTYEAVEIQDSYCIARNHHS
ncbi:hypothetical protein B5S30_g139 [[Candida] boidinii]|nr:hypothetical protein B5S30_g139 [[Candida] boidinii]